METEAETPTAVEPATVEAVVFPWTERGLLDLFVAYVVLDSHALVDHRVLCLAQGCEKLAKSYLLAKAFKDRNWGSLSLDRAIEESCRYAKNDISHVFIKPLNEALGGELRSTSEMAEIIAPSEHAKGRRVTGWEVLNLLPRVFFESRYPHPCYLWEEHPATPDGICHDIFGSSSSLDTVRTLVQIVVKRLEADFSLVVSHEKVRNGLDDRDWCRFAATFLPEPAAIGSSRHTENSER